MQSFMVVMSEMVKNHSRVFENANVLEVDHERSENVIRIGTIITSSIA